MITFLIKFLICFNKPEPPPKKEIKKKKPIKTEKQPKKGKLSKSSVNEEPKEGTQEFKDPNIIKCIENSREWCHIEYCLLDDVLPIVEINVVTWGEAAKVYTLEECRAIRTAVINDLVWVYFVMSHKITALSNEEVIKFKDTKIKFKFSQDNIKMMSSVMNDWPKEFIFVKRPTGSNDELRGNTIEDESRWFLELQQTDPLCEDFESLSQKSGVFKISRPESHSVVSMIKLMPCEQSIKTKLLQISSNLPPPVRRSDEVTKKGKGAKLTQNVNDKKGDKKKKKESMVSNAEDKSQLYLNGKLLIAGKYDACAEGKDVSSTVRYAGIFVNSSDILTEEQKVAFVPFIINIQKIEALPLEKLKEYKIKNIFVRYDLTDVLKDIETIKVPLTDKVHLDDIQVFFLSSPEEQILHHLLMMRPSMIKLAESLLTRPFVVRLFAERETVVEEVEACLFGNRPTDPYISTPGHEMFVTRKSLKPPLGSEFLLGSASINLISLMKGYDIVESFSILTSSYLSFWNFNTEICENMKGVADATDRRSLVALLSDKGYIPEPLLIENCSRVKVKISVLTQLTTLRENQLLCLPQVYFRVILIFYDQSYTEKVIELIDQSNKKVVLKSAGSSTSLTPSIKSFDSRILKSYYKREFGSPHRTPRHSILSKTSENPSISRMMLRDQHLDIDPSDKCVTGFVIEHEQESILVIESLVMLLPLIIEQLKQMDPSRGKILCDTSIFFTKRLYPGYCPLLKIKLPKSLNDLLQFSTFYKSSAPEQALQTLLKLDLLRRCDTLNNACVNQLFPSHDQLSSFCNEFNVVKRCSSFSLRDATMWLSYDPEDDIHI